jgi:hypothetical protein
MHRRIATHPDGLSFAANTLPARTDERHLGETLIVLKTGEDDSK